MATLLSMKTPCSSGYPLREEEHGFPVSMVQWSFRSHLKIGFRRRQGAIASNAALSLHYVYFVGTTPKHACMSLSDVSIRFRAGFLNIQTDSYIKRLISGMTQ